MMMLKVMTVMMTIGIMVLLMMMSLVLQEAISTF